MDKVDQIFFESGMIDDKERVTDEFATRQPKYGGSHSRADHPVRRRELTPDVAGYLLSLRLPETDEERLNELSAKARALSFGFSPLKPGRLHICVDQR
jgi:hypothetical protein